MRTLSGSGFTLRAVPTDLSSFASKLRHPRLLQRTIGWVRRTKDKKKRVGGLTYPRRLCSLCLLFVQGRYGEAAAAVKDAPVSVIHALAMCLPTAF